MALKPTIYKLAIDLSDINRGIYEALNLTIAQHPSETAERMMARVLAYCLHYEEQLSFTKGLSSIDEPDLWCKSDSGETELWIDMGEPSADRVKKASRQSKRTFVYSFNTKSSVWWSQESPVLQGLDVSVVQLPFEPIQALAGLLKRTMALSVTITEQTIYFSSEAGSGEVSWVVLKE